MRIFEFKNRINTIPMEKVMTFFHYMKQLSSPDNYAFSGRTLNHFVDLLNNSGVLKIIKMPILRQYPWTGSLDHYHLFKSDTPFTR
jgi:hypothetical protein